MSVAEARPPPLPSAPFAKPDKPIAKQKVAVLGAGPAGLSVLTAFAEAALKNADLELPSLTCFDRQSSLGGQWKATWRTTVDQHGENVHSGMYQQLWSNGPKECLEFANYTFQQHFGKNIPSYPPREALLDYIEGRAKHFKVLEQHTVHFETCVRRVSFDPGTELFRVVVQDLNTRKETTHEFDYVFCCTGHFHVPNVPSFPGLDSFPGRIMHAHDIRSWEEFKDRRLLIIGTSYSAEDVAVQAYKFGCRSITLSYRTAPMAFHWPSESFATHPLLTNVQGNVAHFKDGSSKEVDIIILATGYLHSFPFMQENLQLSTNNRLWIDNLYKGIFWNPNPRLMYMAMHDQWLTFNMFDAQAWYARDVILGRLSIPDDRSENMSHWANREEAAQDDEAKIRFQTDYTADLVEATDYPSWDYELTVQTFLDWEHAKHDDIFGYRNKAHQSAFGNRPVAPSPRIPWKENMNDTLVSFVQEECGSEE